jgi:hypothetical protein
MSVLATKIQFHQREIEDPEAQRPRALANPRLGQVRNSQASTLRMDNTPYQVQDGSPVFKTGESRLAQSKSKLLESS